LSSFSEASGLPKISQPAAGPPHLHVDLGDAPARLGQWKPRDVRITALISSSALVRLVFLTLADQSQIFPVGEFRFSICKIFQFQFADKASIFHPCLS